MIHNKKRNTALVIEFLKKSITESIINNNNEKAKCAYKILRKYFSIPELKKEKRLYEVIVNAFMTENIDDSMKMGILEEAYEQYCKLNLYKLDKIKDKMIKEINYSLGMNTYDVKLENYKLYALVNSIWKTKNKLDRSKYFSIIKDEIGKIKEIEKKIINESINNSNVNTSILSKFTLNLITEKYNKLVENLLPEQKVVLKNYIDYIYGNNKTNDDLSKFIDETKKDLNMKMTVIGEGVKDDITKKKVKQAIEKLNEKDNCPCKGKIEDTLKYIMEVQGFINEYKEINK